MERPRTRVDHQASRRSRSRENARRPRTSRRSRSLEKPKTSRRSRSRENPRRPRTPRRSRSLEKPRRSRIPRRSRSIERPRRLSRSPKRRSSSSGQRTVITIKNGQYERSSRTVFTSDHQERSSRSRSRGITSSEVAKSKRKSLILQKSNAETKSQERFQGRPFYNNGNRSQLQRNKTKISLQWIYGPATKNEIDTKDIRIEVLTSNSIYGRKSKFELFKLTLDLRGVERIFIHQPENLCILFVENEHQEFLWSHENLNYGNQLIGRFTGHGCTYRCENSTFFLMCFQLDSINITFRRQPIYESTEKSHILLVADETMYFGIKMANSHQHANYIVNVRGMDASTDLLFHSVDPSKRKFLFRISQVTPIAKHYGNFRPIE